MSSVSCRSITGIDPSAPNAPQHDHHHATYTDRLSDGPPAGGGAHGTPRTRFSARLHRREAQISLQVNNYFLSHWPFPHPNAKTKFVAAGFPRVTCWYFPLAMDDRISYACRLLTLLFLIDDLLEDMSLEQGSAFNEKLIDISRRTTLPDPNVAVECITDDLWNEMRVCDKTLADDILEPVFTFMRAQTDKTRLCTKSLGEYLEYREKDVGQGLLSALMRFCMGLNLSQHELQSVAEMERNCAKHISVVNDIYSWEKEVKAAQTGHSEGSALVSSGSVLSSETKLPVPAAKRVLWALCREWELVHEHLARQVLLISSPDPTASSASNDLIAFVKGLEYQMSGNEVWSSFTPRYHSA